MSGAVNDADVARTSRSGPLRVDNAARRAMEQVPETLRPYNGRERAALSRRGRRVAWTTDKPPAQIRRFVEWYCTDRAVGETYRHYAAHVGLDERTVGNWTRDARVVALLDAGLRQSNAGPIKVQALLDVLWHQGIEGNVKASSLYLQAVDRLIPKSRVDVVVHDARGLSDQDLRHELQRALALLNERQPADDAVEDAEVLSDTTLDTVSLNP